ncbi:MAG: putative quinol monooxygenase [Terriglobales bacterium]
MALALLVNFSVRKDDVEKTKELVRKMEEHTRREPGCRHYIGHQSVEDPCRFLFYELYDDQAALDAHRASPHYKRYVTNGLIGLMETRITGLFDTIE